MSRSPALTALWNRSPWRSSPLVANRQQTTPRRSFIAEAASVGRQLLARCFDRTLALRARQRLQRRAAAGWPHALTVAAEVLEDRTLLDTVGPQVLFHTPTEIRNAAFDYIDVRFNEPIDGLTFTIADVTITGPGGAVQATDVFQPDLLDATTFRITFDPLTTRGNYRATIGPDITDLAGNRLNQDGDATPGEASDAYVAAFRYIDADTVFSSTTTIADGNATFDGQDILIDGATVTINGPHSFNSVHLINGAVLTHPATTATQMFKLDLTVAEQLIVDATSRIDVTGKGYLTERTPGNPSIGRPGALAGGSYGGLGGPGTRGGEIIGSPNPTYGDFADPQFPGYGGRDPSVGASHENQGGGLVRLSAHALHLDGQIVADGINRIHRHSSGGSGGGISITVESLTGTGTIRAAGAVGRSGSGLVGGGGGGGRIALHAADFDEFDMERISAPGGSSSFAPAAGGAGTIYLHDIDDSTAVLIVDGRGLPVGADTPLAIGAGQSSALLTSVLIRGGARAVLQPGETDLVVEVPITVTAGAKLTAESGTISGEVIVSEGAVIEALDVSWGRVTIDNATMIVDGLQTMSSLAMINGGLLTHLPTTEDQTFRVDVTVAGAAAIDATSRIDVSGRGYLTNRPVDNPSAGQSGGVAGGSYGGLGGNGRKGSEILGPPNPTYGDYADPQFPGYGGRDPSVGADEEVGGGGLVRLSAQTLHLDGQILADGINQAIRHSSGGSGGGVFIGVGTLTGAGRIRAAGGQGRSGSGLVGGGGGGGRIALHAADFDEFDMERISAPGGSSSFAPAAGGAGTIYLHDIDDSTAVLIVDGRGLPVGADTPLAIGAGQSSALLTSVLIRGGARAALQPDETDLVVEVPITVTGGAKLTAESGTISGEVIVSEGAVIEALDVSWGRVTIDNATMIVDGLQAMSSLAMINGGLLTHLPTTEEQTFRVDVTVAGSVTIDATSRIDVTGKGYLTEHTPGNPLTGRPGALAGGSYGGLGGVGTVFGELFEISDPIPTYGDFADPQYPGYGGRDPSVGASHENQGGGLVRLSAHALHLDGQIVADGVNRIHRHSSGGSGGGIYVFVDTLTGSGIIRAAGATGRAAGGRNGGGGGGGRIAIYALNHSGFNLANVSTPGGAAPAPALPGQPGTIHIVQGRPHTHVRAHAPQGPNGGFVGELAYVDLEFNKFIDTSSFDSSDLAFVGPLGPIAPAGIELIGDRLYRIGFAPQSENGTYRFAIFPTLLDAEGFPLDQNANGIPGEPDDAYEFTLILDTVAPRMTADTGADFAGTVGSVDVWLSERIDKTRFTTGDVVVRRPDNTTIGATAVTEVGLNRFRVSFAPQTLPGTYQVSIGPDVRDLAGNRLDQDGDGVFGEPGDDVYGVTFNLVEVDLGLSDLTVGAAQLTAGELLTVFWNGANRSGAPLVGDWIDAVYLSHDDQWDINDIRLATVPHTGGLAENETYSASAQVLIPGTLPGDYHILVRADIANQERETNEADNVIATAAIPLLVRSLGLDGSPLQGLLTGTDRVDYYMIQLDGDQSLRLRLDSETPNALNDLYVSFASIPTQQAFDHRSATPGGTQQIELTGIASGGTYFILVYGNRLPATYTITTEEAPFFVNSVTPRRHGMAAPAHVTVTGVGFDESTGVELIDADGRARAVPVEFISPTTLRLVIAFASNPDVVGIDPPTEWQPGVYAIRLTKGAATFELCDAFELTEGGEARLATNLVVPGAISPGFPVKQTLWVEYRNTGDIAMPAPLLQVTAGSLGLITADESLANELRHTRARPSGLGNSVQILGAGSGATPGLLQPGESGRVPVYYVGLEQDTGQRQVTFSLGSLTAADTTEKVAYLTGPDERVVFERPQHGHRDINPGEAVWPFFVVRSDNTGTGVTPPTSDAGGGGGGGGGGGQLPPPPPNVFEEFLTIDWFDLRANARPDSIPPDAWDAILFNLRADSGDLWADYVIEISETANYLATVGQATSSIAALWGFEVAQASAALNPIRYLAGSVDVSIPAPGLQLTFSRVYGQSIPSRFQTGVLGRGWTHNWDIFVTTSENGDVTLHGPGGIDRFFQRNSNGTYSPAAGDFAALASTPAGFRLTETDGTIWQFGTNARLAFVEDTNGNRITLAYTGGELETITHSNGRQIRLEYDILDFGASPRLIRVIDTMSPGDADDRVTRYEYEAGREHLTRVIAPGDRATEYAYQPLTSVNFSPRNSRGAETTISVPDPRSHALLSVTHPDGRHDFFSYDSHGRLVETQRDSGAERVTFGYHPPGGVTVTDATGRLTQLAFGLGGQLAQVRDGDGRIVGFGYDGAFQFNGLSGPGGERYRYSYDTRGNLTGIRDALNLQTTFTYETSFNQLSSFTDARGNGIQYEYDARGNLTAIVYVDGSREAFTYDAAGNVLTATNRRGQRVTYTHNAAGQVTSKDYDTTPAFVDFAYGYDLAGNLTEAVDARGTTRMTYDPATDRLARIEYPDGKFFVFEYDQAGRRTLRMDQDGNVVNYLYDLAGRLERMTSVVAGLPAESLIVRYEYDAAGRLSRKTLGNGVFTTYEYDAAGHVLLLVNVRPDGTVLSRFAYEYDVSGRRTAMTTLDGRFEYGYDTLGQLVSVRHPDGRIVLYDYDPAGNRRQVIDDGAVTAYATNALNQYVTVGDAELAYDVDGNLVRRSEGGVTTVYTYDIENRLIEFATGTDVWTYGYDAFGNRVSATHNGQTTQYVIDPTGLGNVAAEYDGAGNLIARYEHGYGLLARTDAAGAAAFYTFQAIGHTSELTDSAGAVLNAYAYAPWGESLGKGETVPNPFEFVGEYGVMNEASGLEFMRARYYNANGTCLASLKLQQAGCRAA